MSFLIEHPDGRRYELDDLAVFEADYKPSGFRIADPQPRWGVVPEPPKRAGKKTDAKADDAAE